MSPDRLRLRVGTRGSRLALWQTDHVVRQLQTAWPDLHVEQVVISTLGDRIGDVALSRLGDKGVFTRELDEGLLNGSIDFAVHSLKDLPTMPAADLALGAVLPRADPRDVLVSSRGETLATLAPGATVGTSSLRRRAQIAALRPDLSVVDLRGNVPTRVDKVRAGGLDAAVLAHAGLQRLGLESRIAELLDPARFVPAPAQGALAVQVRRGDDRVAAMIAPLDDRPSRLTTTAERAVLGFLEGGCQVPVGAFARLEGQALRLTGLVASLDGRVVVRRESSASVETPEEATAVGEQLARELIAAGAGEVLSAIRLAPAAAHEGGRA